VIYTCFDMVRDCRADRPEGWSYFVLQYTPVIRRILAHYAADDPHRVERVLRESRSPQSSLFQSVDPSPERWFVAELRQQILAGLESPQPEIALDLDTVAQALEPLTVVEKLVVWTDTMRYDAAATGSMLRMSPETVAKIRDRASELIRGKADSWRSGILLENGPALGRAAAASGTKDCFTSKVFLDILDGQTSWSGRESTERHVTACWRCVDHFCRMAEVIHLMRGLQPLSVEEAAPLLEALGIRREKPPLWKRWLGA
jgi:hypothetical protein